MSNKCQPGCVFMLVPAVVAGVVFVAVHPLLGLLAGVLTLVGMFYIAGKDSQDRQRWELQLRAAQEQREAATPCDHGVIGAIREPNRCSECQARLEVVAEEKRKSIQLERQAAFDRWKKRHRVPEYLRQMDPLEFEHLACELYRTYGYEVTPTPRTGDGGVDAYARRDGQTFLLQCKRVMKDVGEPVVRDLFGTVTATGANGGILITTGRVSEQAKRWCAGKPIEIVEFDALVGKLQVAFSDGSIVPDEFEIPESRIDLCPKCGKPLRVVRWRRKRFLGCSGYPGCKFTKSIGRGR